jgi:hypothetical protein
MFGAVGQPAVMSVSMSAGAMPLTRKPAGASRRASERVRPMTAAFEVAYTGLPAMPPFWPAIEDSLTMLPPLRSTRRGAN